MVITQFNVSGQNVNIWIDGEFWAEIPYIIAFDFRLHKGSEVDDSLLMDIETKVALEKAFEYSIKYLARYAVSVKKMRQKLYEKEYTKQVVDNTIQKLIEYKYLDDFAFAENLVARKSGKLGKHRLKAELINKGIASDIIEQVLESLDKDDMFESAMAVANKWYRSHSLESLEDNQKFLRFMAYRGFDYDLINRCREVLKFGKDEW